MNVWFDNQPFKPHTHSDTNDHEEELGSMEGMSSFCAGDKLPPQTHESPCPHSPPGRGGWLKQTHSLENLLNCMIMEVEVDITQSMTGGRDFKEVWLTHEDI